jgi:hypothetical protein
MQFYANKNRLPLKTILFFAAVLFIAYLPVSSFLFFLKNDAFTGYFPPKFFMSESIHAGHLPLWNPYINFGIPQYGDMSSGYWSPITWLIASTVGYNAYTFTIEVLGYLLIGGLGMYKLSGFWQFNRQVRIIVAVAFMCCGYNIGHLQHFNWLSGAAFLPVCFWAYLLLLRSASLKNIIRAALLFYLLVASAHPGITISACYFFFAYCVFHFFENSQRLTVAERIKKNGLAHVWLIILFLFLSAGMIGSYLDILPYFVRAEKISLADSLLHPTTAQSWISAILPFATVKNDAFFNTDLSMRNSYFSLTLLLFFLVSLYGKKNKLQVFLVCTGVFFLLLAAGGIFKTIAYKFIPFIGYVRLNGEFSIFAIFCFILVAAMELNKFVQSGKPFSSIIKWIYYAAELFIIAAIIAGLYKAFNSRESIVYNISIIRSQQGISALLKTMVDAISFYDTLWIQGSLQLLVLWGIKWCLRVKNWQALKWLVVTDLVLACLLNIPFTGVGRASVAQVQQVLNKAPKGIPVPKLVPVNSVDSLSTAEKAMVGDWSFYNKQPGTATEVAYPIVLNNMAAYFEKGNTTIAHIHTSKPFIFAENAPGQKISIESFSPNEIKIEALCNEPDKLVLQQNFYPHWYYTNGIEKKAVIPYGINFMSGPLVTGENNIRFVFEPRLVQWGMFVSGVGFVSCCLLLLFLPNNAKKKLTEQA